METGGQGAEAIGLRGRQARPSRPVGSSQAGLRAEVALLVGQEHVPETAIAARLLKQSQGRQCVQCILLGGKEWPQALVFGNQLGAQSIVGFYLLLRILDLVKQGLLLTEEGSLAPGAKRQNQDAQ